MQDSAADGDAAAVDATGDDATGDGAVGDDASDVATEAPVDAGCSTSDAGLGGIGIPSGSVASASSSYSTNTPNLAIDGDLSTYWNAGGYSGSITVTFPSAQTIDGLRIAATASPATNETYSVYGIQGASSTLIGSATLSVPQGINILPAIMLTAGTYDGIEVQVNGMSSWVAIAEMSLLTSGCP
jgi:hypothetical protein